MSETYRQEVFNVLLAQLLQERGVVTAPESIIKSGPEQARRIPDVIVSYYGLRTVIEGEVADQAAAQTRALEAASRRVSQGIAHIAIAVVYPEHLRHVVFPKLKPALAEVELQIAVATEAGETEYTAGNADYLESTLRRAFEQLLKEDVVTRAAALIRAGIEQFSDYVAPKRGISSRMYKSLGMRELRPEDGTSEAASAAMELSERQRASVARVGALVMLNALIFQEILAYDDNRVRHISAIAPKASPWDRHKMACEFGEHWQFILEEINYYPIFHLACQVLWEISTYSYALMALERLAAIAQEIVSMRAALRHDLMGRVYHRLLADAKYLGTYYTSVPAAALLLKLALRSEAWPTMEWHDATKVAQLRIADLACGTGTLLMAAADAVTDNHISASAKEGLTIESDKLQRLLAEATLYGYDVLPSAIHLTASTLALRAPRIPFNRMNLFSLPLGGHELRLGSIEFLKGPQCQMAMDLFGATAGTQRVTGMGEKEMVIAEIPDIDLCVMNPPFTRSVGGNLLFGSVPEPERRLMQDELKKLVKKPRNTNAAATANVTAGLGSVFVAAADPYIKQGGRIALVLPKAFLSGVAWARTRNLLSKKYRVEYIVASHDPQRWNFSENTDLSEVLVVATKIAANNRRPGGAGQGSATSTQHSPLIADPPGDGVVGVNLWRNPSTTFEALAVAHTLRKNGVPDIERGQGALEFTYGGEKVGEAVAIPWRELRGRSDWLLPCAFAQSDLTRAVHHLLKGKLWLPGYGVVGKMALCPLSDLGSLGPEGRDIHDGFVPSEKPTAYRAFWGHDAETMVSLAQEPNRYLSALAKAKPGRPLRKVCDLWPLAAKVLIADCLRLNTQALTAARVSQPVLSNVWWSFAFKRKRATAAHEKALVLWLNSTPGLLMMLARRGETMGAWVRFKKPALKPLPVLDMRALSRNQLNRLSFLYNRVADQALLPLPQMNTDDVRAEIDREIAKTLRIPDFSILREMLAREPIVCLRPL